MRSGVEGIEGGAAGGARDIQQRLRHYFAQRFVVFTAISEHDAASIAPGSSFTLFPLSILYPFPICKTTSDATAALTFRTR